MGMTRDEYWAQVETGEWRRIYWRDGGGTLHAMDGLITPRRSVEDAAEVVSLRCWSDSWEDWVNYSFRLDAVEAIE